MSVPVNYRVNDKRDGKTKYDYFREMLLEVMAWGLMPGTSPLIVGMLVLKPLHS
jgi:hypothetical protein